jgi:hypothetical protein
MRYHPNLRYVFYCVFAAGGFAILWLFAARWVSLTVDRFHTVLLESPALDHFRYDNGVLELGSTRLYLMTPEFVWSGLVTISPIGRVALASGGKSFAFGPGQSVPSRSGLPDFRFNPDPGDNVLLTIERSAISWPTPFEMNFMTGVSPSWRRNAYCRLRWSKRSGAKLEMLWRLTQGYYREGGWSPPKIEAITVGLVRTRITEAKDLENAAVQYLSRTKHWDRSEYRLEDRGPSSDSMEEIIFALHRDDEKSPHPGAGRSVELRLGYKSRRVAREIAGQ